MIIIVTTDERSGMQFNHRRQSQDRILRERNRKPCTVPCHTYFQRE